MLANNWNLRLCEAISPAINSSQRRTICASCCNPITIFLHHYSASRPPCHQSSWRAARWPRRKDQCRWRRCKMSSEATHDAVAAAAAAAMMRSASIHLPVLPTIMTRSVQCQRHLFTLKLQRRRRRRSHSAFVRGARLTELKMFVLIWV